MFGQPKPSDLQLSVQEVAARLNTQPPPRLLDTREQAEFDIVHLPGSVLVTQDVVDDLLQNGDRNAEIICVCHHGIRSLNAVRFLRQQGFTNCRSMRGGLEAWALEIDNSLRRY